MAVLGINRIIKALLAKSKRFNQRAFALLLLVAFVASSFGIPTATVYAAEREQSQLEAAQARAGNITNPHAKPLDPSLINKPMKENYPAAAPTAEAKNKPAADYNAQTQTGIPGLTKTVGTSKAVASGIQTTPASKKTFKEEGLLDKRTALSSTKRNKDGSYTTKQFTTPQFFKKDNKWQDIDTTLVEDKNAADSGNIFGKAFGQVKSWVSPTTSYTVKENDWQGRFLPSGDQDGMVRVKQGDSQVSFSPVGAKTDVNPIVTTDDKGHQTVHYYDLWPGVNVEYEVKSAELKENIIIKDKDATANFAFDMKGAKLKKAEGDDKKGLLYTIDGALDNQFSIAPLVLNLNKYGVESTAALTQKFEDGQLKISLDRSYLQQLPSDAFPVAIDPTTVRRVKFGSRAGGNYLSLKSDLATVCYSNVCNPYAGSVLDSSSTWRSWRGVIFSDYSEVKGHQLTNATLHLVQRLGLGSNSGTDTVQNFTAWHATCTDWFYCNGLQGGTSSMGTVANLDVTNIYQSRITANDWSAWLMITGNETTATTFKNMDPDESYVEFTFNDILPSPSINSTTDNQVYIDPQVSFSATPVSMTGTTLQYNFCVSTGQSCAGAVMNSGLQTAPLWTIPDGLLQDGNTYYIQAQSYDPTNQVYSSWGIPVPFKVDARTGKDSTQAYDTLGPISADLATGNVTTSAASHNTTALGGSLGVGLDYNSPVKSRKGLVGEYWNVPANYSSTSAPTGTPNMTRVDQTVDFNWDQGSPQSGTIGDNWYYARWSGYFVAPTAGTYYFGSNVDDVMPIYVNNNSIHNMPSTPCYTVICYGDGVSLQAGQIIPLRVEYQEATGPAYAHLYVKGAVAEQLVPNDWLQTGVRQTTQNNGLVGSYRKDTGDHDFNNAANSVLMQRTDPTISFDWGAFSGVPGGPNDKFMVRWTGYVTAPTSGNYQFGTVGDDGTKVTIGNSDTVLVNKWNDDTGSTVWSGDYAMTANVPTRITIDYYENTGLAKMFLQVRSSGSGIAEQVVPTTWLSATPAVLPNGWNLGIDSDGNVSYDHLRVTQNSIILSDSTGSTHEYTWDASKNGYKPPVNEDGNLSRNGDGTYTFQDSDGRTYVFNTDGTVQSVTNSVDDLKPAAVQYSYTGTPSKLTQITDGVDSSRWAKVYYWGDATNCPASSPSGFDSTGPNGMLCAVKTNDGRTTSFFYKNGNLGRIQEPGNEITDYQYDTLGRIVAIRDNLASDAVAAGVRTDDASTWTEMTYDDVGRVKTVTQPAATAGANRQSYSYEHTTDRATFNRFVNNSDHAMATRAQMPGYRLEFSFGSLLYTQASGTIPLYSCKAGNDEFTSTVSNCEGQTILGLQGYAYSSQPTDLPSTPIYRCNTGAGDHFNSPLANCEGLTVEFLLGYALAPSLGTSATVSHITGATEPNGFTRRIEYDDLFRTTKDTDIANLSDVTVWDPAKDLVLSTTDETGLMSTTIYDDEDRAASKYGPAPKDWYGNDRKPTSTYAGQIPRTDTAYDEGMQGPAVAYYGYASTSQVLAGAPKLHSTNLLGAAAGDMSRNWGTTTPVTGSNNWGFRATGRLRLPANGQYLFRVASDNGMRLYIDDKLQYDDWNDGPYRQRTPIGIDNTAGSVHRFKLEYYHRSDHPVNGNMDANITVYMTAPGGTETATNLNQYLSPDYSLTTTAKTYDSTLGDSVTKTNYGSNPELGLAQSTSVDPTGLNLTTTSSYETQGATGSFLRQTSKNLPGNPTSNPSFTYTYYGATETRDNPCTTGTTEVYKQAGMLKLKTEADPDGTGTQTGRATETIYDDAGKIVATRIGNDDWACTTYDSRERIATTVTPAKGNEPARTISNDYAVGGSPLVVTTWDNNGWIVTWNDLLGRATKYRDVYDDETTSTYDNFGKLTQRVSPLGTEVFEYDSYNRLTNQKLDGTTYASVTYDQYGRTDHVDYPNAGQMQLALGRDTLGRNNVMTYRMGDGTTTVSDTVNRTQSNQIVNDIVQTGSNQLWYTYGYDNADRITSASIGPHSYSYGFGTQNSSCGTGVGTNPNSGMNGNRTTQTIDGVTSTFCYDYADRLTGSSNALYNAPQYDSHGNMTQIGNGTSPLHLFYDSRDRSSGYEQYDSSTSGVGLYYNRDVQGRIVARYKDTITNGSWSGAGTWYYHYTGGGDTPDYVRDNNWNIIEKTLELPGGVVVTVKPQESVSANQKSYNLPNIHGDTLLAADANGTNTSNGNGPANSFTYDPFGNVLAGSVLPSNTAGGSYGWVGQHEKMAESAFALTPISMGARIYLPGIGRFTQVDPVEGGTENNYAYPQDPINEFDLNGQWSLKSFAKKTAGIASWGSMIPGPIGMACAGVSVAAYAAAGDRKQALIAAASIAAAAVGAGGAIKAYQVVKKANTLRKVKDIIHVAPYSKYTGMNSRLLGSGKKGMTNGVLAKNSGIIRFGWGSDKGNPVLRIGIGHHPNYQKSTISKIIGHRHIDIRRFGWRR